MLRLTLFQWLAVPLLCGLCVHSLFVLVRGIHWRTAGFRAVLWLSATVAVLRPDFTMTIAKALGIGRGTDLVLYLFIFACLGAAAYFYGRLVKLESAITVLVRASALREKPHEKP